MEAASTSVQLISTRASAIYRYKNNCKYNNTRAQVQEQPISTTDKDPPDGEELL